MYLSTMILLLLLLCIFSLLTALEVGHALLLKQFRVGLHSRQCLAVGGLRSCWGLGRRRAASENDK